MAFLVSLALILFRIYLCGLSEFFLKKIKQILINDWSMTLDWTDLRVKPLKDNKHVKVKGQIIHRFVFMI